MKKIVFTIFTVMLAAVALAEDGHRLWMRYDAVKTAQVEGPTGSKTIDIAKEELENYFQGDRVMLRIDPTLPDDEGFTLDGSDELLVITAHHDIGLLYGAYEALHWLRLPHKRWQCAGSCGCSQTNERSCI